MTDSFSVDTMINLVQKLRQEGTATTAKEEKLAMMAVLKGKVEARQNMFNHVKQKGDLTHATVMDCMERVEREAKERFGVVEEFEEAPTRSSSPGRYSFSRL